ncbi:MAG: HU family DNA-binding protein [Prevotellaceae bacterium]|jgi:nucleoid DNA-binding protein|nr:HU family DNA-binding protein [Prevotellaceae bacterium]
MNKAKLNAIQGFNPITIASIEIPAKKVVKFKPGSDLSDMVK